MDIPVHRRGVKEVVKKVIDAQFGRARWEIDHEVYDKEDENEDKVPLRTTTLQARLQKVSVIDAGVGKRRYVIKEGPKKDQAGFHCETCNENFLDSDSLLNHLNSVMHNRKLGMNMKVDKVTASSVRDKLVQKAPAKVDAVPTTPLEDIRKKLEEEQQRKQQKKLQKQQLKAVMNQEIDKIVSVLPKQLPEEDEEDEQIREMRMLGLPVPGAKRVKK